MTNPLEGEIQSPPLEGEALDKFRRQKRALQVVVLTSACTIFGGILWGQRFPESGISAADSILRRRFEAHQKADKMLLSLEIKAAKKVGLEVGKDSDPIRRNARLKRVDALVKALEREESMPIEEWEGDSLDARTIWDGQVLNATADGRIDRKRVENLLGSQPRLQFLLLESEQRRGEGKVQDAMERVVQDLAALDSNRGQK